MATTTAAPDITGRIEQAQREAVRLRGDLERAEGELAQALDAKDYRAAEKAKHRADDLRPHALLAEANVKALQDAASALDAHHRQENAVAIEKERQERYEAARAVHAVAEKEAIEEAERFLAETKASIAAARESLQAALAAEARAGQARRSSSQAAIDAGLEQPSMYGPSVPNRVRAHIDASQLLAEILRTN
ncbi:hypothetical protein ABZ672_16210 [Streptomyces mirabilis]|uniref:hypothetical protein n=1 Tax=Streptomyces mirabilis TaxID=68239 RepID=UPI0033F85A19